MLVNSKRGLILTLLCTSRPYARVVTVLVCDVLRKSDFYHIDTGRISPETKIGYPVKMRFLSLTL